MARATKPVYGKGDSPFDAGANQISFTLNEPAQGSLGVTFGTGPDLARRCMLFGGIRHAVRSSQPPDVGVERRPVD